MLDLELIKKGCEFADGFEYEKENNMLQLPNGLRYYIGKGIKLEHIFNLKEYENILYRDFLQRVIEGIKLNGFDSGCFKFPYKLDIGDNRIGAYIVDPNYGDTIDSEDFHFTKSTITSAKEQAIKYIFSKI